MRQVICPVCGRYFTAYPSRFIRAKSGMVCWGKSCATKYSNQNKPRMGKMLICPTCQKEFYITPSLLRQGVKYCSQQCYRNARWGGSRIEIRHCKLCGSPFKAQKSENKSFCGKLCQYKWRSLNFRAEGSPLWKGGSHPHYKGPNWDKQAQKARGKAQCRCQVCGDSETQLGRKLDVHHIRPFQCFTSWKQANALRNLVALCHSCHVTLEQQTDYFPRHIPLL